MAKRGLKEEVEEGRQKILGLGGAIITGTGILALGLGLDPVGAIMTISGGPFALNSFIKALETRNRTKKK